MVFGSLVRQSRPAGARRRSQGGASLVEFALILFALVTLLFGIVDWGLYFFNRQVITNAVREGARAGIVSREVRLTPEEIQAVVLDYGERYLVTFGPRNLPAPVVQRTGLNFGSDLTVRWSFAYDFLFFKMFSPATITASATMKME